MAFRSSSRLAYTTTGTTAAVPVPAGAAVNDIAVVGFYFESTAAITPPSGFTQKSDVATNAASQGRIVTFWKRLTAADTGTYSFSWTGAAGRELTCGLWSGRITTGDPFSTTPTTNDAGAAGRQTIVPALTALAGDDLVGVGGSFAGSGSVWTATSMTVRQGAAVYACMLASQDNVSAGTTGARTFAYTGGGTGGMKGFLGSLAVAGASATTAALSGTGTLTVAQTPATATTATLGGSGSLSAITAPAIPTTATLSGAGTLSATRTPAMAATGTLSGAGTLTATASAPTAAATATLSGTGTLVGSTSNAYTGTATLSGTGALSATVTPTTATTATLAGTGTLSATGSNSPATNATLSGTGTLSAAAGSPTLTGTATLSGAGVLTLAVKANAIALAQLAGAGTLTVTAQPRVARAVALAGAGTLTAVGAVIDTTTPKFTANGTPLRPWDATPSPDPWDGTTTGPWTGTTTRSWSSP